MFWNKNHKDKKPKTHKDKRSNEVCVGNKDGHGAPREEIQAEAMANFSAARTQIGEETLDRIAAAMAKKQQSAMEQAKRQIKGADTDKVLDELKFMLDSKDA